MKTGYDMKVDFLLLNRHRISKRNTRSRGMKMNNSDADGFFFQIMNINILI